MGDKEFKKLYDSCAIYCMNSLKKWIKEPSDAEDAFSEAISIYWIRLKQGKVKNHDNINAYIMKIALNFYRSQMKADNRIVNLALEDYKHIPDLETNEDNQESDASLEMRQAFKKMSKDCRDMLSAKYVYGYTYSDIANDMGRKSGNSVKVQTFRCAQYLYEMLQALRKKK